VQEKTLEAMQRAIGMVTGEVGKVLIGKDDVIRKVMMAVLANGHILLDDVPGVGKTTLAVALGRALGLDYNRIQFTPDVLPSDIVGFSVYNKEANIFVYMPGVVNNANLLLADEINRTSSRTQAALLEAMEERQVTVDGASYPLKDPFIVIATQNQVGTAGSQMLPHAQLDRFLVKLTVGYPDREAQMKVITERQTVDPFADLKKIMSPEIVVSMQQATLSVTLKESLVEYITDLVEASRNDANISLGISPRGAIAISHMAKASALMNGRDYVTAEDVRDVFCDVCSHRILLTQKARAEHISTREALEEVIRNTKIPFSI
jgi:MoxR-like ATPase